MLAHMDKMAGKRQEEDKGSGFFEELQNGEGRQRLNLLCTRKTGLNGIN